MYIPEKKLLHSYAEILINFALNLAGASDKPTRIKLKAKPTILEPVVNVEVTTPGDWLGSITGDLSSRRGRVFGTDTTAGGRALVKAAVPLAEMIEYEPALKSMTKGRGSFTMELSHYDPVPDRVAKELVAKFNGG